MSQTRIDPDEVVPRLLDGPPPLRFDCGRESQNQFLYESAWLDQEERVSATHLYFVRGLLAGYCTLCLEALELGTRERAKTIRYKRIGAVKLAQLGVDLSFQGSGLGHLVVADVTNIARNQWTSTGCRYVVVDAKPDLVAWYKGLGFVENRLMQKQRIEAAESRGYSGPISVSMRLDLRPV